MKTERSETRVRRKTRGETEEEEGEEEESVLSVDLRRLMTGGCADGVDLRRLMTAGCADGDGASPKPGTSFSLSFFLSFPPCLWMDWC